MPCKTGISSKIDLSVAGNHEGEIMYNGYINVPTDGRYTFQLSSNGKAYVRLHQATLIDAVFDYSPDEQRKQLVNLKSSPHEITLYYLYPLKSLPYLNFSCKNEQGIDILTPGHK